jgi:quinol monooxygenase YgiN
MIHVIADITIKEGQRDAFLRLFHEIVPAVLAEEGCLAYGPTIDVDSGLGVQEACRANLVTVMEQWESVDALKKHLEMPHMEEFRGKVADIVDGLALRVCEPA